MNLKKKTLAEKLEKRNRKLKGRIEHFNTNKAVRAGVAECPGSFTKPGSIK